jgi:hypothetical protein
MSYGPLSSDRGSTPASARRAAGGGEGRAGGCWLGLGGVPGALGATFADAFAHVRSVRKGGGGEDGNRQ